LLYRYQVLSDVGEVFAAIFESEISDVRQLTSPAQSGEEPSARRRDIVPTVVLALLAARQHVGPRRA
jgi:hypothetical protein